MGGREEESKRGRRERREGGREGGRDGGKEMEIRVIWFASINCTTDFLHILSTLYTILVCM